MSCTEACLTNACAHTCWCMGVHGRAVLSVIFIRLRRPSIGPAVRSRAMVVRKGSSACHRSRAGSPAGGQAARQLGKQRTQSQAARSASSSRQQQAAAGGSGSSRSSGRQQAQCSSEEQQQQQTQGSRQQAADSRAAGSRRQQARA